MVRARVRAAFVYAEAADKPVWQTRDELLPTAAPTLFGVRLGGAGGFVIFLH